MSQLWTDLVTNNPVIKDSQRLILKNLNPKSWQANTMVSVVIVGVIYIALNALSMQGIAFLDASLFSMILLTLCILVPAIVVYALIAGEREKRTLDLLLVAPVSAPQIVVAKVVKVLVPILALQVLLTLPSIVFSIARHWQGMPAMLSSAPVIPVILSSILISFCVAVFVSGLSLYVSSVNRSTSSALAGVLALLFVVYVVYAVVAGVVGTISIGFSEVMIGLHPYGALSNILWINSNNFPTWVLFYLSCLLHLGLGLAFFVFATKRLERDRIMVKKKDA